MEQKVERLLAIGAVLEADPGASPYASRTVTTLKKDGIIRLCVHYWNINAQSEKDAFPLPQIYQVWPALSRARYFASLDFLMKYHQVKVDQKDRFKTAVLTHRGLYNYNVKPFLFCNAPLTIQRLNKKILQTLINCGVLVCLDDVLIYPEIPEELINKLS